MMLPHAAARIFNGRGVPIAFRTLYPLIPLRAFANDARKPPSSRSQIPDPASQNRAPVRNRVWPSDKVKGTSSPHPSNGSPGSQAAKTSIPVKGATSAANSRQDALRQTSQGPAIVTPNSQTLLEIESSVDALAQQIENYSQGLNSSPKRRGELENELQNLMRQSYITDNTLKELNDLLAKKETESEPLPDASYGIPAEPAEIFGDASKSDPSRIPLPDLRQGIPSSFEMDLEASSESKDGKNTSLDLTEDPARGGGYKRWEGLPRDAYTTSIERRRLIYARYMYIIMFGAIAAGLIYSGRNWDNDAEEKEHPDAPSGWGIMAFYDRIKARISKQVGFYTEPAFPKLLPNLAPALARPYTLVLSLEDLLVHSEWSREHGWRLAKRPGVDYFLRYLSQYYELVIFTSVQMMNADPIIQKLDPFQIVMWPLFREATRYVNGEHVKDLSYLNRDLSKTIIIDTVPGHVKFQPENAIILSKWLGDPRSGNKNDLVALIPFLEYIAAMSIDDVRKMIKSFEGKDIPTEFAAREARAREAFNKQLAEEKSRRKFGGSLTSALGIKGGHGMTMPGEPSLQEGLAQGKMLSDQARERGIRNYQLLEKQIREHGQEWLAEMEEQKKKAQEESMQAVQSGFSGFMGNFTGFLGSSAAKTGEGEGEGKASQKPA